MNTSTQSMEKPDFILQSYIKTSPQKLREALTNGDISKLYFQGNARVGKCSRWMGKNYFMLESVA